MDLQTLKKEANADYVTALVQICLPYEPQTDLTEHFPFFDFDTEGSFVAYSGKDKSCGKAPYYAVVSVKLQYSLN